MILPCSLHRTPLPVGKLITVTCWISGSHDNGYEEFSHPDITPCNQPKAGSASCLLQAGFLLGLLFEYQIKMDATSA
jgi:hypothetical protein